MGKVDGVRRVETDLNTGIAWVWFESDHTPETGPLWQAVLDGGFTPTKVSIDGETDEAQ